MAPAGVSQDRDQGGAGTSQPNPFALPDSEITASRVIARRERPATGAGAQRVDAAFLEPVTPGASAARIIGMTTSHPETLDAGDDAYVYGYRLWNLGMAREAQEQLTRFLQDYPSHWRTSYGRNLLGRSYLDTGETRRAAVVFLQNFQEDEQGARAPDSLLYYAEAMLELGDHRRACLAMDRFSRLYGSQDLSRLAGLNASINARVEC